MRIGSPRARLTRPSTVGVGRGGPARGRTGFLRRGMTGGVDPPGPGRGRDTGGRRRDAGEVVGAGVGRVVVAERPARVRVGRVFEAAVYLLTRHCYNPNYERGEVSYGPATPGIAVSVMECSVLVPLSWARPAYPSRESRASRLAI